MTITERLAAVHERMARAAERAGRSTDAARLILVTKRQPLSRIREAMRAGARVFGENRLEEAEPKIAALDADVEWHMIGHLQSRKAKHVGTLFRLIHSVDSAKTLQAIVRDRPATAPPQDVLLQVNISGEASKLGVPQTKAAALLESGLSLPAIRVCGLMTMAPADADEGTLRHVFSGLRDLRDALASRYAADGVSLDELSMGMSHDFEIAIEEGATLVRIGTAILGPRED